MVAAGAAVIGTISVFLIPDSNDPEPRRGCTWLAGDLDVHTAYTVTRVRETELEEAATFALSVHEQADLAIGRDLDFLAITDYDDLSAQSDPAYGDDDLIWIPGYEHPFSARAQLLGTSRRFAEAGTSTSEVRRVQRSLHRVGGVLQVAHPGDGRWRAYYGTAIEPDAVEVWFNGPWAYDPRDVGKDMTKSISFYDSLLDRGYRVAATAGSNSLLRGLNKLAGVGQPTTWVCADEVSTRGVLDAIAQGRTTISHEFPDQGPLAESEAGGGGGSVGAASGTGGFTNVPPSGTAMPFVSIEADRSGGRSFEASLGDVVERGDRLRIGVFDAPFSVLRIIGEGSRVLDEIKVFTPTFVHEFVAPKGVSWIRAELFAQPKDTVGGPCKLEPDVASYCEDRIGMLALTSPIYVSKRLAATVSPSATSPP